MKQADVWRRRADEAAAAEGLGKLTDQVIKRYNGCALVAASIAIVLLSFAALLGVALVLSLINKAAVVGAPLIAFVIGWFLFRSAEIGSDKGVAKVIDVFRTGGMGTGGDFMYEHGMVRCMSDSIGNQPRQGQVAVFRWDGVEVEQAHIPHLGRIGAKALRRPDSEVYQIPLGWEDRVAEAVARTRKMQF